MQIIGHLGRDPEMRSLGNGTRICSLNVATSEQWRDKNSGERKEKTEWHRITVWPEKTVDFCDKYLRKADRVFIQGQLETRKWQDQDGKDRYSTEIQVRAFGGQVMSLSGNSGRGDNQGGGDYGDQGGGRTGGSLRGRAEPQRDDRGYSNNSDLDDEIPF